MLVLGIIHDPDGTYVDRQLAPTAGEIFAAYFGCNAVRAQKASYEMSFDCVTRGVELLHKV
jgi:hypothetical protein